MPEIPVTKSWCGINVNKLLGIQCRVTNRIARLFEVGCFHLKKFTHYRCTPVLVNGLSGVGNIKVRNAIVVVFSCLKA